jgi:hypothetical protein
VAADPSNAEPCIELAAVVLVKEALPVLLEEALPPCLLRRRRPYS